LFIRYDIFWIKLNPHLLQAGNPQRNSTLPIDKG
jgi:hypothetical protein